MKTPSTPSFKVTPNTAPPLKVPTPPTQRTLKTSTTINVVELAPTIQTVTSTIARLNVTNAIESLLNNQSVQSKANKFQLTPSINPKYSIAVQSLSLAAGILTTPTSERNNVPNKKMTMLSLNSNISYLEHSEGKEQNTYDINPSSIKTESMTTPSRTRGVFTFPITTAVSANATNTNVQRGDQIKGFDMFPSTNSKNMNYIPSGLFLSTTGGTEVGGNIKSNANHSIHVFGLPGINDIASSDDKPILSAVTTKGPPQAVGINFDDNNMFLPDDGIHLPGLESDDRGLPIVADTDDTTAESYNEGFGLFGNVKSGIVDSAIS